MKRSKGKQTAAAAALPSQVAPEDLSPFNSARADLLAFEKRANEQLAALANAAQAAHSAIIAKYKLGQGDSYNSSTGEIKRG